MDSSTNNERDHMLTLFEKLHPVLTSPPPLRRAASLLGLIFVLLSQVTLSTRSQVYSEYLDLPPPLADDPTSVMAGAGGLSPVLVTGTTEDRSRELSAKMAEVEKTGIGKDDPKSFAACIQVMDDNHFLIEWLAYHYHVMPLRRLVLLPDPHSRTSVQPVLDRWKDYMSISLWNVTHVVPHHFNTKATHRKFYVETQRYFLAKCLTTLKAENKSWVLLTDTDEYTMINPRVRDPSDALFNLNIPTADLTVPSQEEAGSVWKVLEQSRPFLSHKSKFLTDNPCLPLTRKQFGTREFATTEYNHNKTNTIIFLQDRGFNASHFQTMGWRHFGKQMARPKPAKSMIDLRRVRSKDIGGKAKVHRPVQQCTFDGMFVDVKENPFVTNHYSGTLQQMLFRQADKRAENGTAYRIQRFHRDKENDAYQEPPDIQAWLKGFVNNIGEEEAKRLLAHVGDTAKAASFN